MEQLLNLSPGQTVFLFMIQAWVLVIFPVMVIRKLNYIAALLESQLEDDAPSPDGAN